MGSEEQRKRSHLFTLRLWAEELGDGRREWRGRIHHVEKDQVRYFRDWAALIPVLLAMLREGGGTEPPADPAGEPTSPQLPDGEE